MPCIIRLFPVLCFYILASATEVSSLGVTCGSWPRPFEKEALRIIDDDVKDKYGMRWSTYEQIPDLENVLEPEGCDRMTEDRLQGMGMRKCGCV
jgi:hypothetical protein